MVLTPKQRFRENKPLVSRHQEVVVSESFRAAVEAAIVDQVMSMPLTYDPNEAAAAYNRIVGAREFLNHLLNIAEQAKPLPPTPSLNLDHTR